MPQFAQMQLVGGASGGIRTLYGVVLPPGGRVAAYVRSTGPQSLDDQGITSRLVPTLAQGLAECRSGLGDYVVVLPGHSESGVGTTMLSGLVSGTRIIGVGQGALMPTFRWTATTDNWALAANNVYIYGLRLRMEGANGVVQGITWTGADCIMEGCDIELSSGAANLATVGINLSNASASRSWIQNNVFRGVVAGAVTDGVLVSAAVDQAVILGNKMMFAGTTTNGNIRVSGAATDILISANQCHNQTAASTTCIAIADVASTGIVSDNYCSVENNGTAASQGVVFAGVTTTKIRAFQNFCSDEPGKSGALAPAVVAT